MDIGYYVNESKSWLILKDPNRLNEAKQLFRDTTLKFTTEGKRHLGAALGSDNFRKECATDKVAAWCKEIKQLCHYAKTQPQAAFAAFIHGVQHKYTYFLRTINGMEEFIAPLDNLISDKFIPTLINSSINATDRELFSLPIRLGGLNIPIFSEKAATAYANSRTLTGPLAAIIAIQGTELPDEAAVREIRNNLIKTQEAVLVEKSKTIEDNLSFDNQRALQLSQEKGAGSWLSVLPLEDQVFTLTKSEFRDALCIRYNKLLRGLPSNCTCGHKYDMNHALNCKRGGFVILRHNKIGDFEANLLQRLYNDVEIEPCLQPVEGEQVPGLVGDDSKPDIIARSVWREGQNAYFDICVTNTNSATQKNVSIEKVLKKHELRKKRAYNRRIMEIEHGTFTPLIFALNGGVGIECSRFHNHIAERLSVKTNERYESILTWIRCKLSFMVLRASLLCIRGSRSCSSNYKSNTRVVEDFELACDEARLP